MNFNEIRGYTKLSQEEFSKKYAIPLSTLKSWESGRKSPPENMLTFIKFQIIKDYPDLRYLFRD